jgi:hypothetical protein
MKKWVLLVIFLCSALPMLAQDTPSRTQTQPAVLADLARRVGQPSLTLGDLGDWAWFFGTYNYVTGLGCIGAPAGLAGRWQRWEMTYGSTPYVYLITDDAQTIILCNEAALTTPTAVPPATATPQATVPAGITVIPGATATATLIGSASSGSLGGTAPTEVTCALPPRLTKGGSGRVTPGDPNWLHASSSRDSTKTGELAGESVFTVVDGPVCDAASGMNYWMISAGTITAWTSEGRDGEYWLEPISSKQVISSATAATLKSASWVTSFPVAIQNVVFSPGSKYFIVLDTSGRAALYDAVTQNLINELRAPGVTPQPFVQVQFSDDDTLLATSDTANNIYLWDVANVRALGQLTVDKPITAFALSLSSSSNRVIAVATDDGQVGVWSVPQVTPQTPPLIALTVTSAAASLEFSPSGEALIARDASGKMLALWEVVD